LEEMEFTAQHFPQRRCLEAALQRLCKLVILSRKKKLSNAVIEARDLGLYNAITDNGAGGLSSSIGEMEKYGFEVDLSKVPLKKRWYGSVGSMDIRTTRENDFSSASHR